MLFHHDDDDVLLSKNNTLVDIDPTFFSLSIIEKNQTFAILLLKKLTIDPKHKIYMFLSWVLSN